MGKKKNDLSEELIHLNANEESAASLNDGDLDLDLSEIELREKGSSKVKENTLRLIPQSPATKATRSRSEDSQSSGEVKVSYGLPAKQQVPRTPEDRQVHGSGQLKQSEHLRIAQNKINDLEEEIIKLRQWMVS
jgi:hypothetical protein